MGMSFFALIHRNRMLEIAAYPGSLTPAQGAALAGAIRVPTLGYGPQWRDLRVVYGETATELEAAYPRAVVTHHGRVRKRSKHAVVSMSGFGLEDTLKALAGVLSSAREAGRALGRAEARQSLGAEFARARADVNRVLGRLDDGQHGPADDEGRRDRWGVMLTDEQYRQIAQHVREDRKINAIKEARTADPRLGLKEAKDWVEAHWADLGGAGRYEGPVLLAPMGHVGGQPGDPRYQR